MQLKSWSRKQFKKLAKQKPYKLADMPCFVWASNLTYGYEKALLISNANKILMTLTFHVACEEVSVKVAPKKYWKAGVLEDPSWFEGTPLLYKKVGNSLLI